MVSLQNLTLDPFKEKTYMKKNTARSASKVKKVKKVPYFSE